MQQRLQNIEEDRKYIETAQQLEDKILIKENLQRQKNIEYYRELEQLIDDRRQKMKHQINDLKQQIELEKEMSADLILAKTSADSLPSEYSTARETVDEDASSIYHSTGKLSDGFLEKFAKSEQFLSAIADRKEHVDDDLSVVNENFKKSESKNIENDFLNSNSIASIVARNKNLTSQLIFVDNETAGRTEKGMNESHSEPVTARDSNLNEIPTTSMTEWQKNKRKNLNSELDAVIRSASATDFRNLNRENPPPPLTDLERNRQHVMQVEFGSTFPSSKSFNQMKADNGNADSDLVKNRRRILQSEFDQRAEHKDQKPFSRNDNSLTDLEKNRNKILYAEFGFGQCETKKSQKIDRANGQSDLEKNREKVLREEFGYDLKQPQQRAMNLDLNKLSTPTLIPCAAGTPMSIGSDTPICEQNIELDIHNANVNPLPLKLDINLANSKTIDSLDSCPIIQTASSAPLPTPVHEKCEKQLQPIQERPPIFESSLTEKLNQNVQRFFQMPIRQNDDQFYFEKFEAITDITDLQSLNVTTVTQFLQTSFVVPMQAYLTVLSNEVLKMYVVDLNIMGHFKSLRNYFFLLDGEFGSYICDKLISRLETNAKPTELLNFNTLHTILENALGSSIIANDVNSSNLSFIIDDIPDRFDLASPNVIKMLSLSYMIQWPLNLLLNPETISHYAKIFKYLLKIRRISWVLDRSFQVKKNTFFSCCIF